MSKDHLLFAERLRLLRKRKEWNQDELALRVGVHQSTISDWEKGKSWPTIPQIATLCSLFDASADYFVGRSDFTHGLSPDQFLVDEVVEAQLREDPKSGGACLFKVPRRLRIIDAEEAAALIRDLKLGKR